MKAVLDPGHKYLLLTLDGELEQTLTFVKRTSRDPAKFPGNKNAHPGTTIQSVIRALIDRMCYLEAQIHADENLVIVNRLLDCLYLLEHRAMRRHGLDASTLSQLSASLDPMCPRCGHVRCHHKAKKPRGPNKAQRLAFLNTFFDSPAGQRVLDILDEMRDATPAERVAAFRADFP